jgi:hypothetical protein
VLANKAGQNTNSFVWCRRTRRISEISALLNVPKLPRTRQLQYELLTHIKLERLGVSCQRGGGETEGGGLLSEKATLLSDRKIN